MPTLLRSKSKDRADAPGLYMSKRQMGDFLQDLRTNRPTKPTGARPPPPSLIASKRMSTPNLSAAIRSESPVLRRIEDYESGVPPFRRKSSAISMASHHVGRPLVREPSETPRMERDLGEMPNRDDPDYLPYLERSQRWMERQEAHSLRRALEDMDLKEEKELHAAAQQEASDLVWKHQNPNAPIPNPDAPYNYCEHLRKGSIHERKTSWNRTAQDLQSRNTKIRSRNSSASRSVSGGSKSSSAPSSRVPSDSSLKLPGELESPIEDVQQVTGQRKTSDERKKSVQFAQPEAAKVEETKPKERARTPSLQKRPTKEEKSGSTEDVKVSNIAVAARMASNTMPVNFRNPFSRVRNAKASLNRASTAPLPEIKRLDTVEIQRNPPTQSRDPGYTSNASVPTPPKQPASTEDMGEGDTKMKDGKEIRSDEIRKATSMSLKDRSPKLPTPTMVSDRPGRPIVSFDQNWKPKEVELKLEQSPTRARASVNNAHPYPRPNTNKPLPSLEQPNRALPSIHVTENRNTRDRQPAPTAPIISISNPPEIPSIQIDSSPPMPTISVNEAPSISISTPTASVQPPSISVEPPSISVSGPPSISINGAPSARPLPKPSKTSARPAPHHAATAPAATSRGHWTPAATRGSALCAHCALPISGRIVSAAGARFHPECFRCHHCGEGLECVAFYPEPDSFRSERLARIDARQTGDYLEERPGYSEREDGDDSLRFYCHLDFHEFFSPRCKSCKTPIEGEVVVACGAEWHVGHFFCAQCGDPFDADTPFVEKDSYAWCINCHTNRYSTKCRKCKKPVTDTVVKALGVEWHEQCFCCIECGGNFNDGRYFLRPGGTEPFCPACEERRLKA